MGWRDLFGAKAHTTADLFAEAEAARPAARPSARPAAQPVARPAAQPAVGPAAQPASHPATHTAAHPTTPKELEAKVRALVGEGKKIAAVKEYRDRTGLGLSEALAAVEAIARGQAPAPPPQSAAPPSEAMVVRYIDEGKLIQAIKEYRALHSTSLVEAKHAVDRIVAQRAGRGTQA